MKEVFPFLSGLRFHRSDDLLPITKNLSARLYQLICEYTDHIRSLGLREHMLDGIGLQSLRWIKTENECRFGRNLTQVVDAWQQSLDDLTRPLADGAINVSQKTCLLKKGNCQLEQSSAIALLQVMTVNPVKLV